MTKQKCPLFHKKNIFFGFVTLTLLCSAQENQAPVISADSSHNGTEDVITPFFNLGVSVINYQNDNIFTLLANKISPDFVPFQYNSGNNYSPSFGIGLDIKNQTDKNLSSIFEVNYRYNTGHFTTSENGLQSYSWGEVFTNDTIKNSFTLNVLSASFSYKVHIKHFFFSLGAVADIAFAYISENKAINIFYQYTVPPNMVSIYSTTDTLHTIFATYGFKLGAGADFNVGALTFDARVFFNDYILSGYYNYGFVVDIMKRRYKPKV